MGFDVIIGWDFGHGENAVECKRTRDKEGTSLNLDSGKNHEIPTVILYRDGAVKVGNEAKNDMEAIPYFKECPDKWDTKVAGRSKQSLMSDYFREVMKNMREYNPDYIRDNDRIKLIVGCPSSRSWLEPRKNVDAYERLIKSATGVAKAIIMPESRAALISAFTPNIKTSVNATSGAIVIDLGSSTVDFTYMLLGKQLIERSCTLGASHIERAMLKLILSKEGLTPGDIWEKEIGKLELALRDQKEKFYNEGENGYILRPVILDDNGDPVTAPDNKGVSKYERRSLTYVVDDDFMDAATQDVKITVDENGMALGVRSWQEHLRSFLSTTKSMLNIADPPLPYETVVLTGGASRMPFVKEICDEVFACGAKLEPNPSHSVSKGLCFAGEMDEKTPELLKNSQKEMLNKSSEAYKKMVDDCVSTMAEQVYQFTADVLKTVANQAEDITVSQLKDQIDAKMGEKLTTREIALIIQPNLGEMLKSCRKAVVEITNDAVKKIYPDRITNEHFQIPEHQAGELLKNLNLSLLDPQVLMNRFDFQGILSKIFTTIIAGIVAVILISLGFIGAILSPFGAIIAKAIGDSMASNGNRVLKQGRRLKLYNGFVKNRQAQEKEIGDKIRPELDRLLIEQLGNPNVDFFGALDKAIEDAFGVVTLRKFEKRS